MRVRYRLGAVGAGVALLLTTVGIPPAAASGPHLTRLRVEISGNSDWQSVRIADGFVRSLYTEVLGSGATVSRGPDTVVVSGPGNNQPVSATVSMMVEAYASSFTISLAKGKIGEAHTKLYRINNANPVKILSLDNYETSGDYIVSANVSKSTLVSSGYTIPRMDPRRLVLSFYYPWFSEASFDKGPWYDTPTGPYDTKTPSEVSKMVDQAHNAGIDGFVVSWDDVGDHTERFDTVMSELASRSMYVTPVIELMAFETSSGGFDLTKIVGTMKLALQRSSNPAFLKVGTRPVLWLYGAWKLGIADLAAVRAAVVADGYNPFFMGEPVAQEWGLDGTYLYNPNGLTYTGMVNTFGTAQRHLRYDAQINPVVKQRLWAAPVSPGQNMSYSSPLFPQHQDRKDGARYNQSWSAAFTSQPEWVLITSWNEWFEASHISPSKKYGSKALNQTAGWTSAFHNPQPWGDSQNQGSLLPIKIKIPLKFP